MNNNSHIINLLHEGGYSCVVAKGGEIRTFGKRGVADLYELLEGEPELLRGASVADKAVGKAAAALLLLGGVAQVYAALISEPAIALLEKSGIEFTFGKSVPLIQNRDKTGICPLESRCVDTDALPELFARIKAFFNG